MEHVTDERVIELAKQRMPAHFNEAQRKIIFDTAMIARDIVEKAAQMAEEEPHEAAFIQMALIVTLDELADYKQLKVRAAATTPAPQPMPQQQKYLN